jgi:hypothetical protein
VSCTMARCEKLSCLCPHGCSQSAALSGMGGSLSIACHWPAWIVVWGQEVRSTPPVPEDGALAAHGLPSPWP